MHLTEMYRIARARKKVQIRIPRTLAKGDGGFRYLEREFEGLTFEQLEQMRSWLNNSSLGFNNSDIGLVTIYLLGSRQILLYAFGP